MHQVFISYKREQIELAQTIEKLIEADFVVWMDKNIPLGTEWREEIDEEIRNSIALIVIMTLEAKASEYVTYEWSFAYGAGVRVIPVIYVGPDDLHPRLKTLQHVTHDDPQLWDKLMNSLRDAQSSFITIHHAIWGEKDKMHNVTHKVQEMASSGTIELQAHTKFLGEPSRGERKKLAIVYSQGGIVDSDELEEYDTLALPK